MGKSHAAQCLRRMGCHVFDADDCVHTLMEDPDVLDDIAKAFPTCVVNGHVNREHLSEVVFADLEALLLLETILHPPVFGAVQTFLAHARRMEVRRAVLEIPLLFEIEVFADLCDITLCVTAPAFVQHQRLHQRHRYTSGQTAMILARQSPDPLKQQLADYVIHTGLHRGHTYRQLQHILRKTTA